MATEFKNPELIWTITAHYSTGKTFLARTKEFLSVKDFLRWEKSVEAKGYDISCVDTLYYSLPGDTPETELPSPAFDYKWVKNLMSDMWVQEHKSTSFACSVGSETYWCS